MGISDFETPRKKLSKKIPWEGSFMKALWKGKILENERQRERAA